MDSIGFIQNPWNREYVILGVVGGIIIGVFSMLYYFIYPQRTALVILGLIMGLLLFLFVFESEYIGRPVGVKVANDSIILRRRLRKDATIMMDRIVMIYYHTGNPNTHFGRFGTNGGIYLRRRTYAPIQVSPEIAKLVQQRFYMKTGHYPERYPGSDG